MVLRNRNGRNEKGAVIINFYKDLGLLRAPLDFIFSVSTGASRG